MQDFFVMEPQNTDSSPPQSESQEQENTPVTEQKTTKTGFKLSDNHVFFSIAALVIIGFAFLSFSFMGGNNPLGFLALKPASNTIVPDSTVTENDNTVLGDKEVAATVNGKEILLKDVERRFKSVPPEYAGQITKSTILENMIDGELLLAMALDGGVSVTDDEVNQFYSEQSDSAQQLIDTGGFSQEEIKKSIKDSLIVQKYLDETVFPAVEASEEDIATFFEENKEQLKQVSAAHILVETKEEAEDLLQQLKDGADFAGLAKENSTDTASGAQGGELGFFSKDTVVPEFGDAAFALKPGELSDVIQTQFGYHIILLHEIKDTLNDFHNQIEEYLKQQKSSQAYSELIEDARKNAEIKILFKENATQ